MAQWLDSFPITYKRLQLLILLSCKQTLDQFQWAKLACISVGCICPDRNNFWSVFHNGSGLDTAGIYGSKFYALWVVKVVHFRQLEKPKDDEFCLEL
jgi:hypothetical protein